MDEKGTKWTAVDALYFAGAALVSAGAWVCSVAAGLVTAGVFCLAASFLVDRGGRKGGGGG